MPLSLSAWETFYVITGSAGAALTGLMFVVIALVSDRRPRPPADSVSAFSTPTVTHFSSVLILGAIMTVPLHRVWSLTVCLLACALGGLYASARAGVRMRRMHAYAADVEDWSWHVMLPSVAYLLLLASAVLVGVAFASALVGVAVVVVLLLVIGIHNAWDVAVFLVVQSNEEAEG